MKKKNKKSTRQVVEDEVKMKLCVLFIFSLEAKDNAQDGTASENSGVLALLTSTTKFSFSLISHFHSFLYSFSASYFDAKLLKIFLWWGVFVPWQMLRKIGNESAPSYPCQTRLAMKVIYRIRQAREKDRLG